MSKSPSADDLAFAADWLDAYEAAPGDEDNGERAERLAGWLRQKADAAFLREAAREARIPVRALRAAIKKKSILPKAP